jgi:hypothetical protein
MSDELEMVYCKTCREFYEANCLDLGTYFCARCKREKSSKELRPLDEIMKEVVSNILEKQKQKGSNEKSN